MSLRLRTNLVSYLRPTYLTYRSYGAKNDENKSYYQIEEEAVLNPKTRTVYGHLYPTWRKKWIDRQGEWKSKFSVFVVNNPNTGLLTAFSKVPNLSTAVVKAWWQEMKEIQEIENQKYLAPRVEQLGSNLAAIHFVCYRYGAVKLKDSNEWLSGPNEIQKIPNTFHEGYCVEAIDCEKFHKGGIRYEGLYNFLGLNFLKWLSLKGNRHIDEWCLDRIAGLNGNSLEYLDLRGTQFTIGCIYALAKMPKLSLLVINDPGDNMELQAGLSLLEKLKPKLLINISM